MNFDLTGFVQTFLPRLITLLALVVCATIAGIIAAVKNKTFQWSKVADFLRVMVLPNIGGWLLLELLSFAIQPDLIPVGGELTEKTLTGLALAAYSASFLALFGRIIEKLNEMGIMPSVTGRFVNGNK